LLLSKRSALVQYGQYALVYIKTLAMKCPLDN
jgi:hypothetical protein